MTFVNPPYNTDLDRALRQELSELSACTLLGPYCNPGCGSLVPGRSLMDDAVVGHLTRVLVESGYDGVHYEPGTGWVSSVPGVEAVDHSGWVGFCVATARSARRALQMECIPQVESRS